MQVVTVALKHIVRFQVNLDVQIAGRPAVHSRLALAGQANALSFIDARRDADLEHLVLLDAAGALAVGARIGNDFPGAAARRTRLLNRKESLRHAHVAGAAARATRLAARAGLRTRALAHIACFPARDANLGCETVSRLLQGEVHAVAQIGAAVDRATAARPARSARAKNVAKNVAECIGEAAEAVGSCAAAKAAHVRIDSRVTEAVVRRFFLRVGQHLVGFLGLLEFVFGGLG